jgi:hypothetical protein
MVDVTRSPAVGEYKYLHIEMVYCVVRALGMPPYRLYACDM